LLFIDPRSAPAEEEELNHDQARRECFKGKTIYCLALGMAEERAGHRKRALELYRIACKKYPSPGHLRACSPLLTLSRAMGRLEEEAAPLEQRCREGHTLTCYYLGREYLKITEINMAARHLGPLCRNGFRPPSEDDYGPCYHLGKGYEHAGDWNRAREVYELDCRRPGGESPGCRALVKLAETEKAHRQMAQTGIRKFDPVEGVLLFVVFMSILHAAMGLHGGRPGMKYLSLGAPLIIGAGVMAWIYWPDKPEYPANQWAVMGFALLEAMGLAVWALRQRFREALLP
jgi:hypothetical protein